MSGRDGGRRVGPVVLLHAYDAGNRGDGLLVTESLDLLARAGVAGEDVVVVAFDSPSFASSVATFQYPGAPGVRPAGSARSAGSAGSAALAGRLGGQRLGLATDYATLGAMAAGGVVARRRLQRSALGRLVHSASLVVGVGGGYLRAPGGKGSIPAVSVQLPQLVLAASGPAPAVYLPQSVGPLNGAVGRVLAAEVGKLDLVALRDDRSVEQLGLANTVRIPDLAVLAVARQWSSRLGAAPASRVLGIARHLEEPRSYEQSLVDLDRRLPMIWATQSQTKRQNDAAFYQRLGLHAAESTATALSPAALAASEIGVAISVRLHGAVQAILAGIPAIHLTYERKGYGAYDDLGVSPWLHSARSFHPEVVAEQARALLADPSPYWAAMEARLPHLDSAATRLSDQLRSFLP